MGALDGAFSRALGGLTPGRAVLWSQSGAGGQTLAGALTLGKDTEFRTEGGSALTLGANPSGAGALIKSGAQGLVYARTDNPAHAGGTRVQSGLLQWGYTTAGGSATTLRFGGGALCVWQNANVSGRLTGTIDLGGPLTVGSWTAGSVGALSYRGAITLDQAAGGARALRLNHTGSDVTFSGTIADGAGTNALPLQVGIVAGGATAAPFKLAGTNATYAGGT